MRVNAEEGLFIFIFIFGFFCSAGCSEGVSVAAIDLNPESFRGSREPPLPFLYAQRFFICGVWVSGSAFASAGQVFQGGFVLVLLFRGCSGSLPAIPYAKAGPALIWSRVIAVCADNVNIYFYLFLSMF